MFNRHQTKFDDLNYGAVVFCAKKEFVTEPGGSIFTDGVIQFKTAQGMFQVKTLNGNEFVIAKPITNQDGTAGVQVFVQARS